MMHKVTLQELVNRIVNQVPAQTDEALQKYINNLPEAKITPPKPELRVDEFFVSFRRYVDVVTKEGLLEIWLGMGENELIGYVRLDPNWTDGKDEKRKRWEITRAYVRPKYRGNYYSIFMCELGINLAKKNKADVIVAYPRHVAMLITLIDYGFRTEAGTYDATLHRIVKQGRRWYRKNPSARRLYYAQEFRPFIQDGSFIMEKNLLSKGKSFWHYLWEKI
uniref:N-acetyltransferase n=1 Tax=candidate division WOR-3 bacterium TaxID=2052148 RepID=A0A7C6AAS2_UNCW3